MPLAQAQEFYMALKEMKVPVEFVVYPRENHGFTEPRHQMDRVRRYVSFSRSTEHAGGHRAGRK